MWWLWIYVVETALLTKSFVEKKKNFQLVEKIKFFNQLKNLVFLLK